MANPSRPCIRRPKQGKRLNLEKRDPMKINEKPIIAHQDNGKDIYIVHFKDPGQVLVCLSK